MSRTRAVFIASVVFTCSASFSASGNVPKSSVDWLTVRSVADSGFDGPARIDVAPRLSKALLRVENVLLKAPVNALPWPATLLSFEVFNGGPTPLTDLILEISVAERRERDQLFDRTVVGPFTVRGHTLLRAGYTMRYEMLLRNLSSSCDCVSSVEVVSVRWLAESDF